MNHLKQEHFALLEEIATNNNKPWFTENKPQIDAIFTEVKGFFKKIKPHIKPILVYILEEKNLYYAEDITSI